MVERGEKVNEDGEAGYVKERERVRAKERESDKQRERKSSEPDTTTDK